MPWLKLTWVSLLMPSTWPVGDDDGVVELAEGVGARGGDAVVADPRVAAVQVVKAQLVGVVQQDLTVEGGRTEFNSGNWSIFKAVWEISFYFYSNYRILWLPRDTAKNSHRPIIVTGR